MLTEDRFNKAMLVVNQNPNHLSKETNYPQSVKTDFFSYSKLLNSDISIYNNQI